MKPFSTAILLAALTAAGTGPTAAASRITADIPRPGERVRLRFVHRSFQPPEQKVTGTLVALGATHLEVRHGEPPRSWRVPTTSLMTLQVRRSTKRTREGARNGAIAGVVLGGLAGPWLLPCVGCDPSESGFSYRAYVAGVVALLGAGAGALLTHASGGVWQEVDLGRLRNPALPAPDADHVGQGPAHRGGGSVQDGGLGQAGALDALASRAHVELRLGPALRAHGLVQPRGQLQRSVDEIVSGTAHRSTDPGPGLTGREDPSARMAPFEETGLLDL